MSAVIEPVDMFQATCPDCNTASGLYLSELAAEEWAANHDAENHETDNSNDDAYEAYREATRG